MELFVTLSGKKLDSKFGKLYQSYIIDTKKQ